MIKNILNRALRFTLSLSLVLAPVSSYSAESNNTITSPPANTNSVETLIKNLEAEYKEAQKELPLELKEASQILQEMGQALTENRLKEYIDSHPELKSKFDLLSLSNQQVSVLNHKEELVSDIHFDEKNNNFQAGIRELKNIEVDFNLQGKMVFKGVVVSEDKANKLKKTMGLIHTFSDIEKQDIVDLAYDRELLVLLHKKRGLVLYHTMFAKALLGKAPIPSISLPASHLLNLKNVKLEFMNRAVVPSEMPLSATNVAFNLDGKPLYFAGDLLISYDNSEGKKNIARVLSRSKDLIPSLVTMYYILDSLMKIKDFNDINDKNSTGLFYLEKHITELMKTTLSATFNLNSISFFNKFKGLINMMSYFLTYTYIDKNRDSFLHTEWLASYERIKNSNPELFNRPKGEGNIISTQEIAKVLEPIVASEKAEKNQKFKSRLNSLKQKYPKVAEFWGEYKVDMGVILGVSTLAIFQSAQIPTFVESAHYTSNTVYDLVFLGLGLLFILGTLGKSFIPTLKFIKGFLPGEFKLTLEQMIEKWSGKTVPEKLTAFGFKMAGFLLPLQLRVFQIFGQEHLFSALKEGVNPFRKIKADSPLGKALGLNRSMLLGLGLPRWRSSRETYKNKSKLIDLASEQKQKADMLSKIMAYYALSNQDFDIKALLTGPLAFKNGINYQDKNLQQDINWVSQHLSKYILRSQEADLNLPVFEWDITQINNDFFKKAKSLAEDVKSVSSTEKNIQQINAKIHNTAQQALSWNEEYARILMSYYPEPVVATQFWRGLIMDHLSLVAFPLTIFTPRGDFFSVNISSLAVESYTLFRSSAPHLFEATKNINDHIISSANQGLQFLVLKPNEKLKALFEKLGSTMNEPLEQYLNSTNNVSGAGQYFKDLFKYPSNWGQKIYKDTEQEERMDVGFQLLKFIKNGLRLLPGLLLISIGLREWYTPEYSIYEQLLRGLYFSSAGALLFGLPQLWVMNHNFVFNKKAKETKELIDSIKLTAHKMKENLYRSPVELNEDYLKALSAFKKLYSFSKSSRKAISLSAIDPKIKEFIQQVGFEEKQLREFTSTQTIEEKTDQIKALTPLLDTPYLATEANTLAHKLALFVSLGVLSNIVFVYVSKNSFSDLSEWDVLKWMLSWYGGVYVLNLLSAKSVSERVQSLKSGVKKIAKNAKNKCSLAFKKLKK